MIIIASYSNVSVTYTANGTQTVFSFPFDYLRKAFVFVEVNGETDLEQGTDYTVSDDKTVIFQTAPVADTVLRIYRQTDTTPLVSWADASVLKATDMTIQQIQELHILEEYQYNNVIAVTTANEAKEIAEGISETATEALDNSEEALSVANGIAGTAQEALDNSEEALETANNIAGTAQEALDTANEASTTATAAFTTASSALDVAEAKVPIAGGTMTGTLNAYRIAKASDTGRLELYGSTSENNGAKIHLYGKDHQSYPGSFVIAASDGNTVDRLVGNPDGTLTWTNRNVALETDVSSAIATEANAREEADNNLQAALNAKLPLAGGTMNGTINVDTTVFAKQADTDSFLSIYGGTSSPTGASLSLRGVDYPTNTGAFSITAQDGVNSASLFGHPNGVLKWNNDNVLTEGNLIGATNVAWFDTVAQLKTNTKVTAGQLAVTKGYRSINDGGKAYYIIRTKTNNDTTNNYSLLQLATSTLVAELYCPDGVINVKQCGAYGDGSTDDLTYIRYAIASQYNTIEFPLGTYAISGRINVKAGKHLIGNGATLLKTSSSTSFLELGESDITLENLIITRGNDRASGNVTSLVLIHSTTGSAIANIRVTNCIIRNADMYGVNIEDDTNYVRHVLIDHCHIYNVAVGVKNGGGYTRGIVIDSCSIHDTLGECVTFDGTVQNSKLTNCLLWNNDGGVGLVGCDSSSYITIANNTFTQVGNPASARSLQRGLAFNRHMGICNGYVISGNTFNNCYIGVYCKRAETDSQGTWAYNGVKNLVCSNNVFYNSEAADIRIDNIEGDNTFVNNVSNDRSKLYVLLAANKTTIQSRSRFDTENIFWASASNVSVTNSAKSVCSLTLPAGTYCVTGHLAYHTVVAGRQFIGLNTAVDMTANTDSCHIHYSNTAINQTLGMNTSRIITLSSSGTIYLLGYSASTVNVDTGLIKAVRIN